MKQPHGRMPFYLLNSSQAPPAARGQRRSPKLPQKLAQHHISNPRSHRDQPMPSSSADLQRAAKGEGQGPRLLHVLHHVHGRQVRGRLLLRLAACTQGNRVSQDPSNRILKNRAPSTGRRRQATAKQRMLTGQEHDARHGGGHSAAQRARREPARGHHLLLGGLGACTQGKRHISTQLPAVPTNAPTQPQQQASM